MLLAIDPGADSGWALFDEPTRRLKACGLGDPRAHQGHEASDVRVLVVEHPFIYPGGRSKNPNDLIKLAIDAGRWIGVYSSASPGIEVRTPFPVQWKGSVPKVIHHARVFEALNEHEKDIVARSGKGVAPSKRHNMIDAVGLGLYGVGRP